MSGATASLNVLRWSALGAGLIYGIYHQSSVSAATRAHAAKRQWDEQEKLIAQAKEEFKRKSSGIAQEAGKALGLDDKAFDLDKWFASV